MQKIIKKQVILEDDEIKTFRNALYYIKHRIEEHHSKGALSVGSLPYIESLLEELKK
jgi:hypothetical protein